MADTSVDVTELATDNGKESEQEAVDVSQKSSESDIRSGEQVKKSPRPYQTELLEHALEKNTIVNLGTGAGKTFVAVMLIREMSDQIQGVFNEQEGKRTVFLAMTVPLVKQQAAYIRDNTSLVVQDFCGDSKGIDNWPKEKWYEICNSTHVLVMSCQIFLDLLNRAVLKPRQVNLLIFDECHHATKNHPYVQIMKVIKDAPVDELPRILGLSASLLAKKVKPGELKKGVVGLEQILMSHAKTAKDLQKVIKHATTPEEKIVTYSIGEDDHVLSSLKQEIDGPLKLLQTKLSDRRIKLRLGEVAKNLYEDLSCILLDLGPSSAAGFITTAIQEMRQAMAGAIRTGEIESFDYGLACLALTHLTIFDMKCKEIEARYGKLGDSDKVKQLLWILGDLLVRLEGASDSSESEGSPRTKDSKKLRKDDIRGIIFAERRHTASCLCKLLQIKRKEQSDLKRIRCDFVVGHNVGQNATQLRKEARMKSRQQDVVLSKFRMGKINILIATSVIEEGIDVPKCNLVIRFDVPQNFRSYVQSKGRARNKPSLFYLLVGNHQLNKLQDLNNYGILEKELISICQEDRNVPTEEEIQRKMKDKIPPYMPYGRDGARATLGNSLTILHRYCLKLPHDDFTKLSPIFKVVKLPKDDTSKPPITLYGEVEDEDEDPNHDYICTVTLPINCPLKQPIEGPVMGSKLQAHRGAARYAVEELHKLGELDEKFFPSHVVDSDDESIQLERAETFSGTEKRHWLYMNETSGYIQNCFPVPDQELFLYAFIMKETATDQLYCSRTTSNAKVNTTFGLLTKKKLPHLKIPKFSLFVRGIEDGECEVTVSLILVQDKLVLHQEDIEVLKNCHQRIFTDVLKIVPSYLECNFSECSKDYLVVPLKLNDQLDGGGIDLQLVPNIIDDPSDSHETTPSWPCPLEKYSNVIVTTTHRQGVAPPIGEELFTVTVNHDFTPESPFPTPQFNSFQEFFSKKHNYEFQDPNQPSLKAYRLGIQALKYTISNHHGSSASPYVKPRLRDDKKTYITLFPEVVRVHQIPANVFKLMKSLPSILWRLESLLLMEDLSKELTITESIDHKNVLVADAPLGYGDPDTTTITTKVGGVPTIASSQDRFRCIPGNSLMVRALTPKAANDCVNLERLELLGDSLLKIVSSVYLYNNRNEDHERKLSVARSRRISNFKLFIKARHQEKVLGKILSNDLLMGSDSIESAQSRDRLRFLPSGYIVKSQPQDINPLPKEIHLDQSGVCRLPRPEQINYLYHRFNDKMVADCVEALIGVYTVSGGLEGGLRFMKWLNLDITNGNRFTDPAITLENENNDVPLTFAQSSYVFQNHFGFPNVQSDTEVADRETFNRFIAQTANVQQKLRYPFNHHCLMFEALTHPSYHRSTVTGCYQRLEFLGDAVLDYLVTAYLYDCNRSMSPGTISSIRSALLCNHNLAKLSVELNLHTDLMYSSPDLMKKISIYREALKMQEGFAAEGDLSLKEISEDDKSESDDEEEVLDDGGDNDDNDDDKTLDPPKPLGDIFEALCGAVFIDTKMSLSKTWEVFGKFLRPQLDEYNRGEGNIPVNQVRQLYDSVPDGAVQLKKKVVNNGFRCTIKIADKGIEVSAVSRSFKNAKILAANKALQQLDLSRIDGL